MAASSLGSHTERFRITVSSDLTEVDDGEAPVHYKIVQNKKMISHSTIIFMIHFLKMLKCINQKFNACV